MNIAETLKYIHSVKWQGCKPGLERTRQLLKALGNPEKSLKFVHIAGTNGKGSTAACIAAVLQKSGYRTGLYTSPYIQCFNERIRINNENISDSELIYHTEGIRQYAGAMEDPPTEFELITALAMTYFQRKKCDIVVLEVGMGGELDSTNVIETPEIAVITSIGYDHVKELGPTIRDIALAKAGIIKKGGDIIIYGGDPKKVTYMETADSETVEIDAADVFERISAERGARLHWVDFSRITRQQFSLEGLRFDFMPYGEIILPLVGAYQLKNAAAAITALELLREKGYSISNGDIVDGLAAVKWPGRFEVLGHDPVFILDGAHNPQGIKATADSLRCHFGEQKVILIVGVMADKDVDSMIDIIAPLAESFIAVRPNNPRALDARELCHRISRYGIPATAYDTIKSGVAAAIDMAKAKMGAEVKTREGARTGAGEKTGAGLGPGKDSIICALGSLYLSEDIRAAFNVMEN